jgi:membrane-associated phospholipid phosphatase
MGTGLTFSGNTQINFWWVRMEGSEKDLKPHFEVTELPHRSKKLSEFVHARLSAESFIGLYLTVGLLTLGAAAMLFAVIAGDVTAGEFLNPIDTRISVWLHAHNTRQLTTLFLLVSKLHSNLSVTIMTLAISAYLWSRRLRYWVLTFTLAVFGGMLLNFLLKTLFMRPRPHFDNPVLTLTSFSFPSGHTILAAVFYGTLCVFAVLRLRVWKLRVLAVLVATFMIALVGFSRMYLGAHYLSDVLGAVAEGLAWLALCLTAVGLIRHWQDQRWRRPS